MLIIKNKTRIKTSYAINACVYPVIVWVRVGEWEKINKKENKSVKRQNTIHKTIDGIDY